MPSEQDANHSRHACAEDVVDSRKWTTIPAPLAAIASLTALATTNPSTCATDSNVNARPNQRSMSQAVRRASPVLKKAKVMVRERLLPIRMPDAIVAATTAPVTGKRAFGPSAMNAPTAMPAAGQKMGTPWLAPRTSPTLAAKKYAMPTTTKSPTAPSHEWLGLLRRNAAPWFLS
jgi:hypothetical protein